MRAKEYFEKYRNYVSEETPSEVFKEVAYQIFIDFGKEVEKIIVVRKVKSNSAMDAIIKELNQKWNSLVSLFEKNNTPILKKDGFKSSMAILLTEENYQKVIQKENNNG